jgi:signal recognition particle GTPase
VVQNQQSSESQRSTEDKQTGGNQRHKQKNQKTTEHTTGSRKNHSRRQQRKGEEGTHLHRQSQENRPLDLQQPQDPSQSLLDHASDGQSLFQQTHPHLAGLTLQEAKKNHEQRLFNFDLEHLVREDVEFVVSEKLKSEFKKLRATVKEEVQHQSEILLNELFSIFQQEIHDLVETYIENELDNIISQVTKKVTSSSA